MTKFSLLFNRHKTFHRQKWQISVPFLMLWIVKSQPFIYLMPEKDTPFGWSLIIIRISPRNSPWDSETLPRPQDPWQNLIPILHSLRCLGPIIKGAQGPCCANSKPYINGSVFIYINVFDTVHFPSFQQKIKRIPIEGRVIYFVLF